MKNYLETYKLCRGKYVAFLEGDDFFVDPRKLQRQVEFLEQNDDYAICCHNVYTADASGAIGATLLDNTSDTTTVEDLCTGDYISTPSCMIRNGQVPTIPDWIYGLPGCDWIFDVLNAEHGKIKFLPEPMAAYRRHDASMWSSLSELGQHVTAIRLASDVNHFLGYRYHAQFKTFIDKNWLGLAQSLDNQIRETQQTVNHLRDHSLRDLRESIHEQFNFIDKNWLGMAQSLDNQIRETQQTVNHLRDHSFRDIRDGGSPCGPETLRPVVANESYSFSIFPIRRSRQRCSAALSQRSRSSRSQHRVFRTKSV